MAYGYSKGKNSDIKNDMLRKQTNFSLRYFKGFYLELQTNSKVISSVVFSIHYFP